MTDPSNEDRYAPPAPCHSPPRAMQAQARRVGDELVRRHGKRRFYRVDQVRDANARCGIPLDFVCWSHALFNTHEDFDRLHRGAGEACDYASMKQAMLESLAVDDAASGWFDFDFDLSWLEFPDIDWSLFDFFDS